MKSRLFKIWALMVVLTQASTGTNLQEICANSVETLGLVPVAKVGDINVHTTRAGNPKIQTINASSELPASYQRALAASAADGDSVETIVLEKDGVIIGKLHVQNLNMPNSHTLDGPLLNRSGPVRSWLIRNAAKLFRMENTRVMVVGDLNLSGSMGVSVAPEYRTEIFRQLPDIVKTYFEKHPTKPSVLVLRDFSDEEAEIAADGLKGFIRAPMDPVMEVPIRWDSWDGYLAAMRKKYRAKANAARNKFKNIERRSLSLEEVQAANERIYELYQAVWDRSEFKRNKVNSNYFEEMKREMGDDFEFTGYYQDGRLIGFGTSFVRGDVMHAQYLGMDYEVLRGIELYKNILYDHVERGIRIGAKTVEFGRTATKSKSERGAEARDYNLFVMARSSSMHAVMADVVPRLLPQPEDIHQIFKEDQ